MINLQTSYWSSTLKAILNQQLFWMRWFTWKLFKCYDNYIYNTKKLLSYINYHKLYVIMSNLFINKYKPLNKIIFIKYPRKYQFADKVVF